MKRDGDTSRKRPEKKSETFQVRLPFGLKSSFLKACREDGILASEVVRRAISSYLTERQGPVETGTGASIMKFPKSLKKKRYLAVGLGLAVIAGLGALPSAAGPDLKAAFSKLDRNGDGVISAEEFTGSPSDGAGATTTAGETSDNTQAQNVFVVLIPPEDGNPDSQWGLRLDITSSPNAGGNSAAQPNPMRLMFAGMDADRDNQVNLSEFRTRFRDLMSRGFQVLDLDADGFLVRTELARSEWARSNSSRDDDPSALRASGAAPLTDAQLSAALKALDSNRDGRISLEEYLAPA